jgi:hypothetical protein
MANMYIKPMTDVSMLPEYLDFSDIEHNDRSAISSLFENDSLDRRQRLLDGMSTAKGNVHKVTNILKGYIQNALSAKSAGLRSGHIRIGEHREIMPYEGKPVSHCYPYERRTGGSCNVTKVFLKDELSSPLALKSLGIQEPSSSETWAKELSILKDLDREHLTRLIASFKGTRLDSTSYYFPGAKYASCAIMR